jgi:hypothetical protein
MTIDFTDDTILEFRHRLEKMSDAKLIEFGKACAWMADPKIQRGGVERIHVLHLRACREEWRRRHPKKCCTE